MIEKRSKNNIQWKGTVAGSQELREEAASLLRHLRQMTEEDVAADQALRQARDAGGARTPSGARWLGGVEMHSIGRTGRHALGARFACDRSHSFLSSTTANVL